LPAVYLLGERYVDALKQLGLSPNAKVVAVPSDIVQAVRGLLAR